MATEIERLVVAITGNNADVNKALDETDAKVDTLNKNVQTKSQQMSKSWTKIADGMTKVGTGLTLGVTLPLAIAGAAAVKLASDMQETMNKVEVTFGENAKAVEEWAEDSIISMGLANQTAMDTAALYGDMASGMGLTTEEAYNMSTSLVQLSADMASFKNVSQDRAAIALQGIYTGETEALKSLGIVMTETNLKQYAMSQGITKNIQEMSQAEKVQLRYAYVMSVTSNAQGDFERTGGGAANQARMLKEQFKEAGTELGQTLLPMATDLLKWANDMLKGFNKLTPEQKKMIVTIAGIAAAIGPVLLIGGKLIKGIQTIRKGIGALQTLLPKIITGFTGTGAAGASAAAGSTAASAGITATGAASKAAVPGVTAFGIALNMAIPIIGLAAAAVVTLLAIFDKFDAPDEEVQLFVEGTKSAIESAKELNKESQKTIMEFEAQSDLTTELIGKIEQYNGKMNSAARTGLAESVKELNSLYPQLHLTIDETTNSISMNIDELKKSTKAMHENAKAAAAYEAMVELEKEQIKLKTERMALEKKLKPVLDKNLDGMAKFAADAPGWVSIMKLFNEETGTNIANTGAMADALEELYPELKLNAEQIEALKEIAGDYTTEQEAMTEAMQDSVSVIQEKLEAGNSLTESELENMETMLNAGAEFTEAELGQINQQLEAYEMAKNERQRIYEELLGYVHNFWDRIKEKEAVSVDEMLSNLRENQKDIKQWTMDLGSLADRGLDEGLIQALRDAGPEAAGTVRNLVDATDLEIANLNMVMSTGTQEAIDETLRLMGLDATTNAGSKMIDDIAAKAASNFSLKNAGMQQVIDTKESMSQQVVASNFTSIGENMILGAIQGLNSKAAQLYARADQIAAETARRMKSTLEQNSPSKVTFRIFAGVGEGAVLGLESMIDDIKKTSDDFARASIPSVDEDILNSINIINPGNRESRTLNQNNYFNQREYSPAEIARGTRRQAEAMLNA